MSNDVVGLPTGYVRVVDDAGNVVIAGPNGAIYSSTAAAQRAAISSLDAAENAPKGGFGPTYRQADSERLENILTSYYGADKTISGARVGNGGLADAVRYEKATGQLLSDSGHVQKAIDTRRRLTDFIRNADNQPPGSYPYTQRDVDFAKELVKDLDDALRK